jgi:hypothetical protein
VVNTLGICLILKGLTTDTMLGIKQTIKNNTECMRAEVWMRGSLPPGFIPTPTKSEAPSWP